MSRRPPEEIAELKEQLEDARERLSDRQPRRRSIFDTLEQADKSTRFLAWIFAGFATGVIGVTAFYITINGKVSELDRKSVEIERKATELAAEVRANRKVLDHIDELRKQGSNFKEDFFREHGYSAPAGKE